jgi:hypothetical protein
VIHTPERGVAPESGNSTGAYMQSAKEIYMPHQHSSDELFELAKKMRAAGNAVTRAANPGLVGNAMANADQAMFDARVDAARGVEPEPADTTCSLCDTELDEDGECPECTA